MPTLPRPLRPAVATLTATAVTAGLLLAAPAANPAPAAPAASAAADNPVTPGNFTGYGFDQCVAPESWKMDTWMAESPFSAVGIYISGDSRGCREQPNLSPAWVSHQLANGWRLLPITLGPQAACHPGFPRYGDDETIKTRKNRNYRQARRQGRREATTAVQAAQALGIRPGSTLWYDLEGFDISKNACRESSIRFLGAWTNRLHALDYVSGVYSSAGSGIKMLDQVRMNRPDLITLPDRVWIARWDGVANLDACRNQPECYVRPEGWQPHERVKQYRGGHHETWGGVTINIDSNYLSLGKGTRPGGRGMHCKDTYISRAKYPPLSQRRHPARYVATAKCLLRKRGVYDGPVNGRFDEAFLAAVNAWQERTGTRIQPRFTRRNWVQALAVGKARVAKHGMSTAHVRRMQWALTAATGEWLNHRGAFLGGTERVVKLWQGGVGLPQTGVMNSRGWELLKAGRRR